MAIERARMIRKNTTEAERVLGSLLRKLKREGVHFRRQVPIGYYIADFACYRAKIAVELDGWQHAIDDAVAYDSKRTAFLTSRGYRVLRFWNGDVLASPKTVTDFILAESKLRLPPPPAPPRVGGGEFLAIDHGLR